MTKVYYNEFDPNAAAWLRELIADGLIAPGDVDERSIIDVSANDIKGYGQCHWFAGIGGWSYALRLADWPDDKPVWTASLPCQPFSTAGKQLGKQDERHLLPYFLELVKKCKPDTIFGEQVERAIGHGWLDDLQTNMEAEGYAVGHVVLGAHSIGSAHIRQRLYWVADSISEQREQQPNERSTSLFGTSIQSEECVSRPCDMGTAFSRLGISNSTGSQQRIETTETARHRNTTEPAGGVNRMADTNGKQDNATNAGGFYFESRGNSDIEWLYCRDGKYRPIESGIKPLVDGVPRGMVHSGDPRNTQEARAMRLKGYGNAIVPTLAAEFIKSYMEVA